MIKILFFAGLRELAGVASLQLPWHASLSLHALRQELGSEYPKIKPLLDRSQVAVNDSLANEDVLIPENAEVAFLPPVSGG